MQKPPPNTVDNGDVDKADGVDTEQIEDADSESKSEGEGDDGISESEPPSDSNHEDTSNNSPTVSVVVNNVILLCYHIAVQMGQVRCFFMVITTIC